MTSLIVPRYELPIVDDSKRMSRDWYKFFAQLGAAIGPSLSSNDDQSLIDVSNNAAMEALGLAALRAAQAAQASVPPDLSLLAYWPD